MENDEDQMSANVGKKLNFPSQTRWKMLCSGESIKKIMSFIFFHSTLDRLTSQKITRFIYWKHAEYEEKHSR